MKQNHLKGRSPLLLSVALLGLSSCQSVPTPSGRPELKVRLTQAQAKGRIVNKWSTAGWFVQGSDDIGFNLVKPLDASESVMLGNGTKQIRVNLTDEGGGITQIRATFMVVAGGMATDGSGAKGGCDIQRSFETLFSSERVDGPYMK